MKLVFSYKYMLGCKFSLLIDHPRKPRKLHTAKISAYMVLNSLGYSLGYITILSNTLKVFRYTTNDFGVVILVYLVIFTYLKLYQLFNELHFIYF